MIECTHDEVSVPILSDSFHTHCSFSLDDTNRNFLPSQYDSVLQDDINWELYSDALDNIDSDLDKHPGIYTKVGEFTFSDNYPLFIYWDPYQCSAHVHGERIYQYISGADLPVFVNDSEDDGTLPHNHSFWVNYFHHAAEIGISNMKVHEVLEPKAPPVTTPSKIYHESMQPFFTWIPVEYI